MLHGRKNKPKLAMSGRGKGRAAGARKRKLDEYEWAEGEDVAAVGYSTVDVNEAQLAIVPLGKLESYIFEAITLMSKEDLKYTLQINCIESDAGNLFEYIKEEHVREIEGEGGKARGRKARGRKARKSQRRERARFSTPSRSGRLP